ncbi:MAG: RimK family alpha-L-glutamate ligase [Clostridia bacterium]|nr:RimK family alpha-L-glutamate ligase [Clostridia bacterium]
MKGLILKNSYYDPPFYRHGCERIREELTREGVTADLRDTSLFPLTSSGSVEWDNCDYDFCVYLDKDKYLSRLLSQKMRLFNSAEAVEICDDKMLTVERLARLGFPLPATIPGLLCYRPEMDVPRESARTVGQKLGYPVIVKTAFGSMGKGVVKADTEEELWRAMREVKTLPHLFQEYIAESAGRDLRVIVVGGKVVGCMERRSDTDFRSNVGNGGRGIAVACDDGVRDLAESVANALGLDYCGIDLLFSQSGMKVCEVNSNAFFEEFEKVTGINVAGAYAKHIVSEMKK